MRFLVLGASGMAGHAVSIYLKERGHSVVGFSRRGVSFLEEQVVGDARDGALLAEAIGEGGFDVVVNCVGVLNQDAERDPEGAACLNGELPHVLARICEGARARVFHMSTDCVFAGNAGPYAEGSVPDGRTVYDRTKAAGELDDGRNLTFRCSVVGPDMRPAGIGLLNWFMQQPGPVRGWTRAMWTGLTTLELAKAMECAALEGSSGLVNMVPPESISKYDLLRLFDRELRDGKVEIVPDGNVQLDKTLVRTNYGCSFRPGGYAEQVAEMAEWMRAHKDLYPHYEIG